MDAKSDAESKEAFRYSQKALFSYQAPKKFKKNTEKYFFSFLPVDKDKAAFVGWTGYALLSGSISTRNFSNLKFGVAGWSISPEVNLNIRNGESFTSVNIGTDF
jgi:hypothetical protein